MVYNIKSNGNPTRFIICITDLKVQEKSHSIAWSSMVLHRVVMMKIIARFKGNGVLLTTAFEYN